MSAHATPQTARPAGRRSLSWSAPVVVALVAAAIAMATTPPQPDALATGRLVDVADAEASTAAEVIRGHVGVGVEREGAGLTVTGEHESPTVAALAVNRALAAATEAVDATAVPAPVPRTGRTATERPVPRALIAGLFALVVTGIAMQVPPARRRLPGARRRAGGPAGLAGDSSTTADDTPAGDIAGQILRHRSANGATVSSIVVSATRSEDASAAFASALAAAVASHDQPVLLVEEDRTSGLLESLLDLPRTETARMPVGGDRTITCSAAGLWGPTPVTTVLARKRLAEWTGSGTVAVIHVSPGTDAENDVWSRAADAVVVVEDGTPVILRFDDRPGRAE